MDTPPPHRARRRRLRALEVAAYALGATLVLAYSVARLAAEAARADGVAVYQSAQALASETEEGTAPSELPQDTRVIDQSSWSSQRVRAFAASMGLDLRPEGLLRIPSLGLEVPIYAGTGELALNSGAGHIEGTAALGARGNTGIAAHRDGFFRLLERIDLDAELLLHVDGRELRYRVFSIEIVMPEEVHVLADTGTSSITLVTCYPFYFVGAAPQRFVVRADLVEPMPPAAVGS
jgi:sortase A